MICYSIAQQFEDKYQLGLKIQEALRKNDPKHLIKIAKDILPYGYLEETLLCFIVIFEELSKAKKINKYHLMDIRGIYDQITNFLQGDYKKFFIIKMSIILIKYNDDLQNLDFLYFCSKVLSDLKYLE